jgi:hypothetical protein
VISDAIAATTKTNRYPCSAVRGNPPSEASPLRTGPVLAKVWPNRRIRAICVMNSNRPDRPSPHPLTTSTGPESVRISARIATMNVSTMAKTRALGM